MSLGESPASWTARHTASAPRSLKLTTGNLPNIDIPTPITWTSRMMRFPLRNPGAGRDRGRRRAPVFVWCQQPEVEDLPDHFVLGRYPLPHTVCVSVR